MYGRILVLLDGSERSEVVLPHVKNLASGNGSTVIFLHVLEPGVVGTSPFDSEPELNAERARREEQRAAEYLSDWQRQLDTDGIQTQQRVERGPVVSVILDVADRDEVDLIAMASHGRTGLARVLYGSTAAGVLNGIDRPLLLMRSR